MMGLTLIVHLLVWGSIRGVGRIIRGVNMSSVAVIGLEGSLDSTRWGSRVLSRLISDRRQLNGPRSWVGGRGLSAVSGALGIRGALCRSCSSLTLLLGLACSFLFLFTSLPLLPDFLELWIKK